MGTKCKFKYGMQIFSSTPQMISAGGNITSNQTLATSVTETVQITETVYANTLNSTSMQFRVFIGGEITENAGTGDITFTLRYGGSDILELATGALAAEADKPFKLEYTGHILTAGSSAKIVAVAFCTAWQGTPLYFASKTPLTGQAGALDLTADGSLNVTAKWDVSHGSNKLIVTHGWIEFYN